jgi:hypothetical protein
MSPSRRHLAVVEHSDLDRGVTVADATFARAGPACCNVFVKASCTMRYADRSMPAASGRS